MFCKLAVLHHLLSFFCLSGWRAEPAEGDLSNLQQLEHPAVPTQSFPCHFQMKIMEKAVVPSEVTHGMMDSVKEQLNFRWCISYVIRPHGTHVFCLSVVSAEQWEVLFFTHGKQSIKYKEKIASSYSGPPLLLFGSGFMQELRSDALSSQPAVERDFHPYNPEDAYAAKGPQHVPPEMATCTRMVSSAHLFQQAYPLFRHNPLFPFDQPYFCRCFLLLTFLHANFLVNSFITSSMNFHFSFLFLLFFLFFSLFLFFSFFSFFSFLISNLKKHVFIRA